MRADLLSAVYRLAAHLLGALRRCCSPPPHLLTRLRIISFAGRDLLWKCALVGPLFTATAHSLIASMPARHLDMAPAAAIAMQRLRRPRSRSRRPMQGRSVEEPRVTVPAAPPRLAFRAPARVGRASRRCCSWGSSRGASGSCSASGAGIRSPMPRLRDLLETLCLAAGYPHYVRLTAAPGLASPVALPGREICLPQAIVTDLGREQQRGVLAHELAHLVRRDPLWLGIAQVMERLFFLQPLNWLARRELQVTAEYVCDDWAAHHVGSGLPLARCLLTVAEWIAGATGPLPEPAMAARGSHLMRRVERLVRGDGIRADRGRYLGLALGVAPDRRARWRPHRRSTRPRPPSARCPRSSSRWTGSSARGPTPAGPRAWRRSSPRSRTPIPACAPPPPRRWAGSTTSRRAMRSPDS